MGEDPLKRARSGPFYPHSDIMRKYERTHLPSTKNGAERHGASMLSKYVGRVKKGEVSESGDGEGERGDMPDGLGALIRRQPVSMFPEDWATSLLGEREYG